MKMKSSQIKSILLAFIVLVLFCSFSFISEKPQMIKKSLRVQVFKSADFSSYTKDIHRSIRNLKYIRCNDEVSSIIVEDGTIARFYRGAHYAACSFEVVGPAKVSDLQMLNCGCGNVNAKGWDNEISSIRLYPNADNRKPGIYGDFRQPQKSYPYNEDMYQMNTRL